VKRSFLALAAAALLALPLLAGEYYVNLASQILIAAVFALSLNLLVGYCGLTSLGHAAYLGLAAYFSAWFSLKLGLGQLYTAPLALGCTTLCAALFGLVALRASGLGFLMITLAIGQVLWGLAFRWASVTGGDNGLSGLTRPSPFGLDLGGATAFYYFTVVIAVAAAVAMTLLAGSAAGALMRGTRDQPRRMGALGHNVWLVRYLAFVAAGFFGGVAGLQYVWYHKFVHPHSLSLTASAETLLMVIAGGSGTVAGPVVGAVIVVLLKSYVSSYVERWTMLLGFVFLMIVLFMPDGLVPGLRRAWSRVIGKPGEKRS
jgi:branched-chain amino acid transport system permease protein